MGGQFGGGVDIDLGWGRRRLMLWRYFGKGMIGWSVAC